MVVCLFSLLEAEPLALTSRTPTSRATEELTQMDKTENLVPRGLPPLLRPLRPRVENRGLLTKP